MEDYKIYEDNGKINVKNKIGNVVAEIKIYPENEDITLENGKLEFKFFPGISRTEQGEIMTTIVNSTLDMLERGESTVLLEMANNKDFIDTLSEEEKDDLAKTINKSLKKEWI